MFALTLTTQQTTHLFTLFAHRIDYQHNFQEHFTSLTLLDQYILNHPEIAIDQICIFELNPQ